MKIDLLTIADCPNWEHAWHELQLALHHLELASDVAITELTSAA